MTRTDTLKSSFLLSLLMIAGALTAWAGHTVTFYVNGKIVSTAEVEEGASIPFPAVVVPTGYAHLAWTTAEIDDVQASAPKGLVTNATMGNAAIDYYAVFVKVTERTKWQWPYDKVNGTGIYAIINKSNRAFNGTISGGEGQLTTNDFSSNGAPEGTLELTLTAVTDATGNIIGYTMYAEGKGYLYAFKSSSGGLAWHDSEDSYWYSDGAIWKYNKNGACLRSNGNTSFNTYSGASNAPIYFARKVRVLTDYCTKFPEPTTTITTAGWATYAPAYSVSFQEGTSAYIVKAIENTTDEVALHSVSSVRAGTPVLLKGTAGVVTVITMDVTNSETNDVTGNLLRVSDGSAKSVEHDPIYVLSNVDNEVGFYMWAVGNNLPEGKIYLRLPEQAGGVGARPFIALPGEETAISDVNREATTNNRYFDLHGRRVLQPTKGLYIVNGKLVMIK